MQRSFDFCVLGNGPLGAAAAWYLTREGASVCLIGASTEQLACSHNDHSRIYRTHHGDPYWTALAEANLTLMLELEQRTGIKFFRPAPVYYDEPGDVPSLEGVAKSYLARNGFIYQDPSGGIIDPLSYIRALNKAACEQGAEILKAVVKSTSLADSGYQVHTADGGPVRCNAIADFRGLYATPAGQGTIVARTVLLVRHSAIHETHSFIRTNLSDPDVAEFFGCSHLDGDALTQTSKFVFADKKSILLDSNVALDAWFHNGYQCHPKLSWAIEEIRRMGFKIQDLRISPCAFTRTINGLPDVRMHKKHLRFYGCNGAAAKCAQSLARLVLTQHMLNA